MASEAPAGRGPLRPRARLLRTLGTDLISSDKVALIELVKNSYDADALNVLVRFHGPLAKGRGRIEIWDDGHGMDIQTLQTSWFDIAADTKKKKTHTENGRRVLGEKGIGRLAAARVGDELMLTSRQQGADEVSLLVDWTEFDRDGAYLDEVEIAWQVGEPEIFSDSGAASEAFTRASIDAWHKGRGTMLQIEKLTRSWSSSDLAELRTALARLVRPRPLSGVSNPIEFGIYLDFVNVQDGVGRFSGPVEPSSGFQAPHYRLTGSVDANGLADLRYSQLHPLVDEHLGVRLLWSEDTRSPEAGPFGFELSVWDRDNQAIQLALGEGRVESTSPDTKELKGFRRDLDEVAGVSVYRDGFRVLPFGERGDDWLGLDLRRVQNPTLRVSNNQIIGHIFIDADKNSQLRDQSNREGLLDVPAYADLKRMVVAALAVLEDKRYGARRPPSRQSEPRGGLFKRFDLGEIRVAVESKHPSDSRLLELIDQKSKDIRSGVVEVQTVLSRYSRLATLGSLIDRVLHDGRTVVARLKNISRFGERDIQKQSLNCEEKLELAHQALGRTTTQATHLGALFNQIEPFGGRKRGRPKDVAIRSLIQHAVSILEVEADEKGVEIQIAGDDFSVRLDVAEVLAVLINLIQNAIHWTATIPKQSERRVVASARKNSDASVTLSVSDSGPGVPAELREVIFDPYFSSKPDGVGLGLSIAGNIVEDIYHGELVLVDGGALPGATFEATFRRRV